MRRPIASLVLVALLSGCGGEQPSAPTPSERDVAVASEAAPPEPDLSACPKAEPAEFRERTKPVPVPPVFERLAKSDMDHLAFATADGNTICVDTTWIESIDGPELSEDGRFASFAWLGYEAFGHVIVDRSGQGQVVDTGNAPLPSPDGKRLASVDLSESGFGSLNALAVWDVRPAGLRPVAAMSEGFPAGDWRIEGWQGESCVRLSVVPIDRQPQDYRDMDKAPRDPWFAAEANGWKPAAGSCPRA
jgi:hypothetical protein